MKQLELQIQHLQIHNVSLAWQIGSRKWFILYLSLLAFKITRGEEEGATKGLIIRRKKNYSNWILKQSLFFCSQNALEEDVAKLEMKKSNKIVKCFSWLTKVVCRRNINNNCSNVNNENINNNNNNKDNNNNNNIIINNNKNVRGLCWRKTLKKTYDKAFMYIYTLF